VQYSPVLTLEPQPKACGPGEAYRPTSVDVVLGRPDVLLRDPRGRVVKRAPRASDLWERPAGYYLDFPGDPLSPLYYFDLEARGVAKLPARAGLAGRLPRLPRAIRPADWVHTPRGLECL
jgi:hypothetical protein